MQPVGILLADIDIAQNKPRPEGYEVVCRVPGTNLILLMIQPVRDAVEKLGYEPSIQYLPVWDGEKMSEQ